MIRRFRWRRTQHRPPQVNSKHPRDFLPCSVRRGSRSTCALCTCEASLPDWYRKQTLSRATKEVEVMSARHNRWSPVIHCEEWYCSIISAEQKAEWTYKSISYGVNRRIHVWRAFCDTERGALQGCHDLRGMTILNLQKRREDDRIMDKYYDEFSDTK